MYGSIFRMKVKTGHDKAVAELFKEWDAERKPKVKGAIGGFLLKPDKKSGVLIGAAMFEDEASFRANGADPEQDKWYQRLRMELQEEPAWEDGEYVAASIS